MLFLNLHNVHMLAGGYRRVAPPGYHKPVQPTKSHIPLTETVCAHLLTIIIRVSVSQCLSVLFLFFHIEAQMWSHWSARPVCFNLSGKTMGWLLWHNASNCCYMVLEGYMLLFLYVVAYFADLGTVGNNDCCCRSNDVGNFFFLFHIYLLTFSHSPDPDSSSSFSFSLSAL